jgi:hypothetical protein
MTPQSAFPNPVDDLFKDDLARLRLSPAGSGADPLAVIPWSSPLRDSGDRPRADVLVAELPSPTVKCFDRKRQKFNGLTDALWGACVLAAHAIHPDQSGYGSTLWASIRPQLKNADLGNLIVPLTVVPETVSLQMTVGELEKSFRRSFVAGMKGRTWLTEIKEMVERGSTPRRGSSFFDVSNVGYFPTTGPFLDTWSQQSETAMSCNGVLALATVTVFGKEKNARLTVRLPYSQHVFTRSDITKALKAVLFYLRNVRRDQKVGDVIRAIREEVK